MNTNYKHGLSKTRLHRIWRHMKTRCTNPKCNDYPNYGGRGITICADWRGKDGFLCFYDWATSHGYTDLLTIDRIDVNGNYEPTNCRWISQPQQTRNRRNVVTLTYNGETISCAEWSRKMGLYPGTVNNRLHKGWSVEECLFGKKQ